jgi:hypothetical protein
VGVHEISFDVCSNSTPNGHFDLVTAPAQDFTVGEDLRPFLVGASPDTGGFDCLPGGVTEADAEVVAGAAPAAGSVLQDPGQPAAPHPFELVLALAVMVLVRHPSIVPGEGWVVPGGSGS